MTDKIDQRALESVNTFYVITNYINNVTVPSSLNEEMKIMCDILVKPLLNNISVKNQEKLPQIFYGLLVYFFVSVNVKNKKKDERKFEEFLNQLLGKGKKKKKKKKSSKKGGSGNLSRRKSRSSNNNSLIEVNTSKSTLNTLWGHISRNFHIICFIVGLVVILSSFYDLYYILNNFRIGYNPEPEYADNSFNYERDETTSIFTIISYFFGYNQNMVDEIRLDATAHLSDYINQRAIPNYMERLNAQAAAHQLSNIASDRGGFISNAIGLLSRLAGNQQYGLTRGQQAITRATEVAFNEMLREGTVNINLKIVNLQTLILNSYALFTYGYRIIAVGIAVRQYIKNKESQTAQIEQAVQDRFQALIESKSLAIKNK